MFILNRLSSRWLVAFGFALLIHNSFGMASIEAETPQFLKKIFTRSSNTPASEQIYELSDTDGPFLILASTLMGEGARDRANQLAIEIRQTLDLPAFIYKEAFDYTGTLGVDPTAGRTIRYAHNYKYDAYAVLVGEYDSVSHPQIQTDLARIRAARPAVLEDEAAKVAEGDIDQPHTATKRMASLLKAYGKKKGSVGPMAKAFVTRNPMLPEDYFTPPQVDAFVSELNETFPDHNLLDCKSSFTVIVKTFHGQATIEKANSNDKFIPNARRLDRMARKADMMVRELRKRGVEAYQFHDRSQSIVTIGGFASLGRELPGGGFEYDTGIQSVMQKYNALNVDPAVANRIPANTNGIVGNGIRQIPFDVQPRPIAVPRKSKKSLYSAMTRK